MITELTEDQQQKIAEYRERYFAQATSTAPAGQLAMASTLAAFRAGCNTELMINVTTASTTFPKAPPMITATARSTTLPRLMKALKSTRNDRVQLMG